MWFWKKFAEYDAIEPWSAILKHQALVWVTIWAYQKQLCQKFYIWDLRNKRNITQVLHWSEEEDNAARQAAFHNLVVIDYENLLNNFVFIDEASLHICSYVNKHNYRIWAEDCQLQPLNSK